MPALEKLRAERGQMSAMDRRIADYILANARLLRDYSSQQLADTLKVSQSSIVKFSQRLGFKGYPDLKLSITEAVALASKPGDGAGQTGTHSTDPDAARAEALWRNKAAAVRETRAANAPEAVEAATRWITEADTLFIAGGGIDADAARALAGRIALVGRRCIAHVQPHALLASLASATPRDVLLLVCGHEGHSEWQSVCRELRAAGGRVVVVMRRGGPPLPAADACLVVAAHDSQPHLDELVYEAAMRQLLDDVFLRVLAARPDSLATFVANRARSLAAQHGD
jgi:DNA-binding MurR/RpiR family transcriptional regulator